MPNVKVLQAVQERHQAREAHAQRVYTGYADQVPKLIHALAGVSQADHRRALRVLTQMSFLIVPQLIDALANPALDAQAQDEVVAVLGLAGDRSACEAILRHFDAVRGNPQRASLVALSLARLGEPCILPFLRAELDSDQFERVLNAVSALRSLGELEDITRLRAVHRTSSRFDEGAREIRKAVVSAILAILDEVGGHSAERFLDQIRNSFADRALWKEISDFSGYTV